MRDAIDDALGALDFMLLIGRRLLCPSFSRCAARAPAAAVYLAAYAMGRDIDALAHFLAIAHGIFGAWSPSHFDDGRYDIGDHAFMRRQRRRQQD